MSDLAVERYSKEWCRFDPNGAADRIAELEGRAGMVQTCKEHIVIDDTDCPICWAEELEAQIAELESREPLCRCADEVRCDHLKRITELKRQIEAVKELPEKWREDEAAHQGQPTHARDSYACATELQAILNKDAGVGE